MAIKQADGSIVINHATPVTVTPIGEDVSTNTERFAYADSSLVAEHVLLKRDIGRKVSGSLVTRKGKITIIREHITGAGVRRSAAQSANLLAHSDLPVADVEQMIADLGQFLLDNKADLAAGLYDS